MSKLTAGAYGEYEEAKHAIFRIASLAMSDKKDIITYITLLAEIGTRANGEAEKLRLIQTITYNKETDK